MPRAHLCVTIRCTIRKQAQATARRLRSATAAQQQRTAHARRVKVQKLERCTKPISRCIECWGLIYNALFMYYAVTCRSRCAWEALTPGCPWPLFKRTRSQTTRYCHLRMISGWCVACSAEQHGSFEGRCEELCGRACYFARRWVQMLMVKSAYWPELMFTLNFELFIFSPTNALLSSGLICCVLICCPDFLPAALPCASNCPCII